MIIPASYLYPDILPAEAWAAPSLADGRAGAPAEQRLAWMSAMPGMRGAIATGAGMVLGIVAYGGLLELVL